ncbi:MAG TPA: MmgE/PrpD family protein [Candidatus Limnocylindria bacterium]|nr:MmgE/PrpD family protein [Candidatus Limnocylindria bacterium]
MTVTRSRAAASELASFCADLRWDRLPAGARERTKELVLDLVGVAMRGSAAGSSRAVQEFVATQPGGSATVIGTGRRSGAPWAALANGTGAHATELDDVTRESSLHPGVAVIPAALAVAQERSAAPIAFLEAVVAGYEVTMRVGNALGPASAYARGFHPTGVAGVFGAAVAAGRLAGLDAEGLTRCIGIAGTMASGSIEYVADGSWTKRLNAGWAAHAGIVAAGLAASGFTGPATALDGRSGVLTGYTDAPLPELLTQDLGRPLQVMKVTIKPYACCRYTHPLIDAILALRREHRIEPDDVERVRLGVLSGGALLIADPIERKREPENIVDAQFSAPFGAAVALVFGKAGLAEHSEDALADPRVRALMPRTDCVRDTALDASYPGKWEGWAELALRDGRTVRQHVEFALGEPENPVSREALVERFVELAAGRLDVAAAHALAASLLRLDEAGELPGLG